jgi:hypothetical protein
VVPRLEPLLPHLLDFWALPATYKAKVRPIDYELDGLLLSFQGSERQRPSLLQMSLTFAHCVKELQSSTTNAGGKLNSDEKVLINVMHEYNASTSNVKWQLSDDSQRGIRNMIFGVSARVKMMMTNHLHFVKWADSGQW